MQPPRDRHRRLQRRELSRSQAVFNRGLISSDVIDVNGAVNLTLEDLTITGGEIGVDALTAPAAPG